MKTVKEAKTELVRYGRKIAEKGLVVGPGGNTSIRLGKVVYLKASGIAFEEAKESDYVGVDLYSGEKISGRLKPSSEIMLHLGCYKERDDINAIVHTHSPYATAVATCSIELKTIFPEIVALIGKNIARIDYIIPTGYQLAKAVKEAIKTSNAILLSNHGIVTVGVNLRESYYRALLLEEISKLLVACHIFGNPRLLTEKEIDEIDNLTTENYRRQMLKGI
jgi:L-fuculose-phosphate aldolase